MSFAMWRLTRRAGFGLVAILSVSCSGDSGGPGAVAIATMGITPSQVSLLVGATRQLTVELRDARGTVITGRSITWISTNPSVASVSGSGLVTALTPGSTRVVAAAEGRSTDIPVDVTSPPIATIVINAPAQTLFPGQTLQLTATARDAAGNVLAGKIFAWSSSNAGVIQVSQAGVVTGVATGGATISAAAEGISGNLALSVTPAPAALIAQITPATLVEGGAGTITGSGFSATPSANIVSIDGVNATVTQATATSLQFVVPAFDCRPRRSAPVQVTVNGGPSNVLTHAVSPASFLSLAVGQQAIVAEPSDRCLQFDASNTPQRYVVGVQSVSDVVATLTPVTVSAGVPSGAITTPALPVASLRPAAPAAPVSMSQDQLRWQQHMAATSAAYERQIAFLNRLIEQTADATQAVQAAVPTIPATVREGDQIAVRFPNFSGNTCSQFTDLTVRVRRITPQAIFLEDVGNPEQLAQSVFDQAGAAFATVYAVDVDHFGAPGDLDQNQRIAILLTKEVNKLSTPPLGFVSYGDLFPTTQCAASNEGEVFYLRSSDPTGQFTAGTYTSATLVQNFTYLLAHEFAHIIQATRRRAAGANFMTSWLAEGLATAAQEVTGFQMLGLQNGANYGRTTVYSTLGGDPRNFFGFAGDWIAYFGFEFNNRTKVAATPEECSWVGSTGPGGNPGPCQFAARLVYGLPWTVIKYTIDRHLGGAANQKQYLRAFSDYRGAPGFAELQGVLGRTPSEMLAQWAAMLYIDDRYPAATAFQFLNWNIRDIAAAWQSPNADLIPRTRGFSSFTDSFAVRAGSSAYYEISGASRPATAIRFRGDGGVALPPALQVWIVRVQ
jgi:hypothetical protein